MFLLNKASKKYEPRKIQGATSTWESTVHTEACIFSYVLHAGSKLSRFCFALRKESPFTKSRVLSLFSKILISLAATEPKTLPSDFIADQGLPTQVSIGSGIEHVIKAVKAIERKVWVLTTAFFIFSILGDC